MQIQLLYFPGCPNVNVARVAVARSLASLGLRCRIEEVDATAEGTPEELRRWGSPTILVDGSDVAGEETPTGAACRLYRGAGSAPSIAAICAALVRCERRLLKG